jgi:hypothetical protein
MQRFGYCILLSLLACADAQAPALPITTPDDRPHRAHPILEVDLRALYKLVRVNGVDLPVPSPWGIGQWDYDSDAGTWNLTGATLALKTNGTFLYEDVHQAASGRQLAVNRTGTYLLTASSLVLTGHDGSAVTAVVSGNQVGWGGLTFTLVTK